MKIGKSVKNMVVAAAVLTGAVLVPSSPAFAASGGGCGSANLTAATIQPCISYRASDGKLLPDFYVSDLKRTGYCWYSYIQRSSGSTVVVTSGQLTRTGRYGPWAETASNYSSPVRHYVKLATCGTSTGQAGISPFQYWP